MPEQVRNWVEGGRGFIEVRFRADQGGLRQARETERKLVLDGFTVINVHQTGGHLSAGRSIATSLVGVSRIEGDRVRVSPPSRDPGEIVVTFEKTGLSQAEIAEQERQRLAAQRTASVATAEHQEFQRSNHGGPHGRAAVGRSQPGPNGAVVEVQVMNTDPYDWSAYEVELVVYRPQDGKTLATFKKTEKRPLSSGRTASSEMPISNIPAGDVGVLVGVPRVLVGKEWR